MRIRIACECSKRFSVDDKHLGKLVKCPGCQKKHRVVASSAPAPAPAADDTSEVVVSPLATYAPFIVFGSLGAFLLLSIVVIVVIVIGIRSVNSTPPELLAEAPKDKSEDKKAPTVSKVAFKKEGPEKKAAVAVSPEEPKQTTEGKEPPKKAEPKEEFVSLRFRLEEDKGEKKHSAGAIEVAIADKAPVPYKVRRLKPTENAERKRLRLAVTKPQFDNMGKLLDALGDGYRYRGLDDPDLNALANLRQFDVLFLTCKVTIRTPLVELKDDGAPKENGPAPSDVLLQQVLKQMEMEAKNKGVPFDPNAVKELFKKIDLDKMGIVAGNAHTSAVIRRFVEEGGTLYASDLRYDQVLSAFPEMGLNQGPQPDIFAMNSNVPVGHFDADVVDSGLRQFLGKDKIELHLESSGWKPAYFDETKVTIMLRGQMKKGQPLPGNPFLKPPVKGLKKLPDKQPPEFGKQPGMDTVYPLLAKFQFKKGTVIFTSFHNATQNSDIEKKLLEYLVFSLVNASSEAKLKQIMLAADFTLEDLQLLSFSKEKGGITKTYAHAGGSMQIAVGFENVGDARFRLQLKSPQGNTITHEEPGLYLIEVPAALAGNWEYTVTPVAVPYDNFPVMLGIGKGK